MIPLRAFVALLIIVMTLMLGCVERREKLSIAPDGSIAWQVTHRSESRDDLYEGDATPIIAAGWLVRENEERGEDDRTTFELVAERVIAPDEPLPDSFGFKQAGRDVVLQFPTSVVIDTRQDGVYYHFTRRYQARPWGAIELLAELLEAPLEDLGSDDPEDWTEAQRVRALRAFADFEIAKMLTFARAAWMESAADLPQDFWLAVRGDMLNFAGSLDYAALAELIVPKDVEVEEARRKKALDAEVKRFEEAAIERLRASLQAVGVLDHQRLNRFMSVYEREQLSFEVTEDLGDDAFEITVEMPGEIIAGNATKVSGRTATWAFSGEQLRDNAIELLVTSRARR